MQICVVVVVVQRLGGWWSLENIFSYNYMYKIQSKRRVAQ